MSDGNITPLALGGYALGYAYFVPLDCGPDDPKSGEPIVPMGRFSMRRTWRPDASTPPPPASSQSRKKSRGP
jgi:hypothetical protein